MKKVDKRKKTLKTIALSIFGALFLGGLVFLTFQELYTEKDIKENNTGNPVNESEKFKNEFEDLNNKTIDNITYISVNINSNNKIKYVTEEELIKKLDNKETCLVFFGYSKCPWCRAVVENFINESIDNNIDNIYYLNIEEIRDEYKLNDNKQLELIKEGTEGYKILLTKLDSILNNYESFKYLDTEGVEIEVPVNEKRIYGPTLMFIKDGVPTKMTNGISALLKDPLAPRSDEMNNESKQLFDDIYNEYNSSKESNVCYSESNC